PLPDGTPRERYVEGVRRDIEDMAAIRLSDDLVAHLRETFPNATDAAVRDAIAAADTLHQCGLFVESGYGDSAAAVDELSRQVPGFSRRLYENVIAYFGFRNH